MDDLISSLMRTTFGTSSRQVVGVTLLSLTTIFFKGTVLLQHLLDSTQSAALRRYTALVRRIYYHRAMSTQPHMSLLHDSEILPSMSFLGGGQLWPFSLGVGHYLYKNYEVGSRKIKYFASSCGCFTAVPLACGLDPYDWCKTDWTKCLEHYGSRWGGAFLDSKHFYYKLWDEYLPADAHVRCTNNLFLSVTLYPSMQNQLVSTFKTRDALIWTIVASTALPLVFFYDYPVNVPEVGDCIDGSITNDSPCLDSYTITVSALHNEADISPRLMDDCQNSDDGIDPAYWSNPLNFIDTIRTPPYERVWQIGSVGQACAVKCSHFQRREWAALKRRDFSSRSPKASPRRAKSFDALHSLRVFGAQTEETL